MTLLFILGAISIIGSYFAWSYIHEMSHILMAKYLVGLEWYKIKVYPHVDKRLGFVWASTRYMPKRKIESTERALISLTPRLPGIVACALAPLFVFLGIFGDIPSLLWLIFWGAGVVDVITGSMGISKTSDLKRAAYELKLSPWLLRPLMLLALPTVSVVVLLAVTLIASI